MTITIESASPPLSDELLSLLRDANDSSLDLAAVAWEKLFARGRDGATTTLLARIDGELAGVAATAGSYLRILAVRRDLRRRGAGSALLQAVLGRAAEHGSKKLVVGAEPGNYFLPGVEERDLGTRSFFDEHGFRETSDAVNLVAATRQPAEPDPALTCAFATPADRDRTLGFVLAEFGAGWIFEVESALAASPPGLILASRDGELLGFAAIDTVNRGLGTFGPAGVAARERGTGTGRALLLVALRELRKRGYGQCIIQWAAALPFYEKSAGATVLSRYVILSREIGPDSDRVKNR